MQLSYHQGANVGDAINPLIFGFYLGEEFFDDLDDVSLLGIGSIIGLKSGLAGKKLVFSSGLGGGDPATYGAAPIIGEDWDVRAVRGPLTACALNLPEQTAVVDGAYLVRDTLPRLIGSVPGRVGFIPHHMSLGFFVDWDRVCEEAGLFFLDVRLQPLEFMERLWSCESVLSEAMHGAIFADAYGIPWMPLRLYGHINEFKWNDWWASVDLAPVSHWVPTRLHSVSFFASLIKSRGVPSIFCRPAARLVLWMRRRKVVRWLRQVASCEYYLSDRQTLAGRIEELHKRLVKLKSDYGSLNA
jgi:hypothetical protein